ncbi:GDP-mannose 4,6-dehydratase [Acidobacteriia bacterium AH_259_A11_L15]|nr:GDP-mannose 4,6-dehydratase [Acidobacteriia bacterium AH_259_A11_L15]
MTLPVALITGLTGQDGSYLVELLLQKGYRVFGLVRRASTFNTGRVDHLLDTFDTNRLEFLRGDLTDGSSLARLLRLIKPGEIYHLAAQTHVMVSFEIPEYTADTIVLGTIRLLEGVREVGIQPKIYNACSSEVFGNTPPPQNEHSPMAPRSPYAAAKACAYHCCRIYREGHRMWIANGILFNHESPRRGETFVTRKVTRAVARIKLGLQNKVMLGNLEAHRDWGYAPEFVEAMWRILQQEEPDDYVIATGDSHSVLEFVEEAFGYAGLAWRQHVEIDARLIRPLDVDYLLGDSRKARSKLRWQPKTSFKELVHIMVDADLKRERILLEGTAAHHGAGLAHL